MALSISFYLLNPNGKTNSQVYVSISDKTSRLRFAIGESFKTEYCNIRKVKGSKDLVKKNSPFVIQYRERLKKVDTLLHEIELELSKSGERPSLNAIRDSYYVRIGKIKSDSDKSFEEVFDLYSASKIKNLDWSESTKTINKTLLQHIKEFCEAGNSIDMESFNHETWQKVKLFFVDKGLANSSTNKYLKALKAFMRDAQYGGYIKSIIAWDKMKMLENGDAFKIALKEEELDKLITLDLSNTPKYETARDLFIAECLTGQRISDIHKVLDSSNNDGNGITLYQQKTGERVFIPLHAKLKKHLDRLMKKYPEGFPKLSDQKINMYLKELFEIGKFDRPVKRQQIVGNKKEVQTAMLWQVISSHDGRRTFCTLSLKRGIDAKHIMKVTGHQKRDQFDEYVTVDDEDLAVEFNK